MENVLNEVNVMLLEMFVIETQSRSARWVQERLAAGDRESVRAFLRRINGSLTDAEGETIVTRILRDATIVATNHIRF